MGVYIHFIKWVCCFFIDWVLWTFSALCVTHMAKWTVYMSKDFFFKTKEEIGLIYGRNLQVQYTPLWGQDKFTHDSSGQEISWVWKAWEPPKARKGCGELLPVFPLIALDRNLYVVLSLPAPWPRDARGSMPDSRALPRGYLHVRCRPLQPCRHGLVG